MTAGAPRARPRPDEREAPGRDRDTGWGADLPPTTRGGLRRVWREGGRGWAAVPAWHRPRNLAIARAYLETDEPLAAIAARHGLHRSRVPALVRSVVYNTLGRRLPSR